MTQGVVQWKGRLLINDSSTQAEHKLLLLNIVTAADNAFGCAGSTHALLLLSSMCQRNAKLFCELHGTDSSVTRQSCTAFVSVLAVEQTVWELTNLWITHEFCHDAPERCQEEDIGS